MVRLIPTGSPVFMQSWPEKYEVALIKFFMKNVALTPALMQADQIHPNAEGQPYLLDNAWTTLEELL